MKNGDLWLNARTDTQASVAMDAVTRLAPLERFVFVMSVLEGYSDRKCCLFLSCTLESLMRVRLQALRKLPTFDPALAEAAPQRPHPLAVRAVGNEPWQNHRLAAMNNRREA